MFPDSGATKSVYLARWHHMEVIREDLQYPGNLDNVEFSESEVKRSQTKNSRILLRHSYANGATWDVSVFTSTIIDFQWKLTCCAKKALKEANSSVCTLEKLSSTSTLHWITLLVAPIEIQVSLLFFLTKAENRLRCSLTLKEVESIHWHSWQ